MAVKARDIPLTRETVYGWLTEYQGQRRPTKALTAYLTAKLKGLGLDDTMVDTHAHDSLKDETPLIEMILADLPSYA